MSFSSEPASVSKAAVVRGEAVEDSLRSMRWGRGEIWRAYGVAG
eukprot:CAMPEP_0182477720 /NCGR_PEP_ID=MMETSP1319-20130603/31328_1 /TAXON_ID=172717 /ORGANISM="Bolidomonas pacifica, Strain RCC208" /LENGTH=43 /DNA_ID= /DNA_START= /DNA_END= /DNA_ORIENTATION=